MKSFSYEELDQLTGEVLPERAVLSTMSSPFNNNNLLGHGGGDAGTTVVSSCNTVNRAPTAGLVGALGLGANSSSVQTCTPAAVVGHG